MNKMFPIENKIARQVWNNFDRELIHKLKLLPEEERADIRLEILSHLYESIMDNTFDKVNSTDDEDVRLINAISNLGSPEDYLTPLISDILLYQKASKGHPIAILQGLKNAAKRGFSHTLATLILGMGYFWVIMIFIMSVLHIVNTDIGIWYYTTGEFSLSFTAQPDATQWLPEWFSLVGIIASSVAYWGLNKVLSYFITKLK